MKLRTSKIAKGISTFLILAALFISAVSLEEYLRARKTKSIPVDSSELPGTIISASQRPDFLGWGTAWWIDTDSSVPFELEIDSSRAEIPEGTHKIFSNHDYENLHEFGLEFQGEFPVKITARPARPNKAALDNP